MELELEPPPHHHHHPWQGQHQSQQLYLLGQGQGQGQDESALREGPAAGRKTAAGRDTGQGMSGVHNSNNNSNNNYNNDDNNNDFPTVVLDCANLGWAYGMDAFSPEGVRVAFQFFAAFRVNVLGFLPASYYTRKPKDGRRGNAVEQVSVSLSIVN